MDKCNQNFCRNIYYLRKRHHLTQKEMAKILKVGIGTLRRIEAGVSTVRLYCTMLDRVCEHFHISADSILRDDLLELELKNASPWGWHWK